MTEPSAKRPLPSAKRPLPSAKRPIAITVGVAVAIALVAAILFHLEVRGPRPTHDTAPPVQLQVSLVGKPGAALAPNGALPHTAALQAAVTLARATRVSLVHIDVDHGMETLVLNEAMGPGTHTFAIDGGALSVPLSGMSGPQILAAVASDRPLIKDEALSAGKGYPLKAASVAAFHFTVAP